MDERTIKNEFAKATNLEDLRRIWLRLICFPQGVPPKKRNVTRKTSPRPSERKPPGRSPSMAWKRSFAACGCGFTAKRGSTRTPSRNKDSAGLHERRLHRDPQGIPRRAPNPLRPPHTTKHTCSSPRKTSSPCCAVRTACAAGPVPGSRKSSRRCSSARPTPWTQPSAWGTCTESEYFIDCT